MSDKEFVDLVRTMRNAQTIYFRSKNWSDLRYARDYEQRVDNELRIRAEADRPKQAALI